MKTKKLNQIKPNKPPYEFDIGFTIYERMAWLAQWTVLAYGHW
jgi:hypothetical protein